VCAVCVICSQFGDRQLLAARFDLDPRDGRVRGWDGRNALAVNTVERGGGAVAQVDNLPVFVRPPRLAGDMHELGEGGVGVVVDLLFDRVVEVVENHRDVGAAADVGDVGGGVGVLVVLEAEAAPDVGGESGDLGDELVGAAGLSAVEDHGGPGRLREAHQVEG
jgi:hypothetical protein